MYTVFSLNTGGIEKMLIDIVNEQTEINSSKIYVCIINNDYDNELVNKISEKAIVINLNRPKHGRKINYILKFTYAVLKNKIDVIHCQDNSDVKISILSKILKPKLKIFRTVHNNLYGKMKRYEIILEKIFVKKIIAISESVKNNIAEQNVNNKMIIKIYNGINLKNFPFKVRRINTDRTIIIGNSARIVPHIKGQDILIQAVALCRQNGFNVKCIFAGEAEKEDSTSINNLRELSRKLNIEDSIYFYGNVTDISSFLNKIDIFVLPSRYEGFGISLVEAMAMGIPCIASDIDGPREIIKDKYGQLFKCGDYVQLSHEIENTISKNALRTDCIRNYVADNYDIKKMVNRLNVLYSN